MDVGGERQEQFLRVSLAALFLEEKGGAGVTRLNDNYLDPKLTTIVKGLVKKIKQKRVMSNSQAFC